MASPAGPWQGLAVVLAWGLAPGRPPVLWHLVTGYTGHQVEITVLLAASSNPWNSQSAFAPLHPDIVALAGQGGGKAPGSKPEAETLCF